MLDETLVICLGEFGRSPKINQLAGRDHWPGVQSILLAGAGLPGGTVYGASDKLGGIMDESKSMGGGLAQAMFTKVADKFYDLVVSSDVGIIDVSWGLKDQKTQAVTRLSNQKSQELKALDEDFRKVMEEDK